MNSSSIDFFRLDDVLTAVQIQLRDQVRAFVQQVVLPHINPYWEQAAFPWEIVRQLP
ncbi:MAG: acyl-CoA dehydrogenase family protein, partial [Anaerolineales bacterium]|nr:acyl-CoA dehydrogenase family protein [Anaerolineales bacterium]